MRLSFKKFILHFREPAGTSRGVLFEKPTYILKYFNESAPEKAGVGEASYFPGLSPEDQLEFENKLHELSANLAKGVSTDLEGFPALRFGLEQAVRDFEHGGRGIYFPSGFTENEYPLTINGLIWMGDKKCMLQRIEDKIAHGFHCIKIKIGAINWNDEMDLIHMIRMRYGEQIEIRVDANGGLKYEECMPKLETLSKLKVHSIEQPIEQNNPEKLRKLCSQSPLPIALDEELIGVEGKENKQKLLDFINPQYIILKPSLCGGFFGASEWIELADGMNIGWWITSALESSIGLNALAQFAASLRVNIPQGLGTGALYMKNFPSYLRLESERLYFDRTISDATIRTTLI